MVALRGETITARYLAAITARYSPRGPKGLLNGYLDALGIQVGLGRLDYAKSLMA